MASTLDVFLRPSSVAVVGASDDSEKIGGRPLRYMREFGFGGQIIAVNPRREVVQGIPAVPSLSSSVSVPDVALIAVPGQAALDAVIEAARIGVQGCVILSSGFGETATEEGRQRQQQLLDVSRASGMRLVGPNSQGLANFSNGAVLGFSTLFTEQPPLDGPVAIISQSGAMCSVPYGILRRRGVGVRYAHGTGNDVDITAAELAAATIDDEEIRLVILYLESVNDRESLVLLAERSRERNVPVVALVGGRSTSGSRAAASHTGALATERRVLDAFLERLGIWQVSNVRDLVGAAELYLQDWQPSGSRLAVLSNSGAVCVLAADAAEEAEMPLAELQPATVDKLTAELPAFATVSNPIDVTAALLTDSSIFGRVLPLLGADPGVDTSLLGIPVAGRGYDVARFAADAAAFVKKGNPLVLAIPQPSVAQPFRDAGLAVFDEEASAISALAQFVAHHKRLDRARRYAAISVGPQRFDTGDSVTLDEPQSLAVLESLGVPVVPHRLVSGAQQAVAAFVGIGSPQVVVKGCTNQVTHKSDLGLVRLRCSSQGEVEAAVDDIWAAAERQGIKLSGFLVAPMVAGIREVVIGGHLDPVFGPVILIGAGGVHVEAVPDAQVLLAPCSPEEVRLAVSRLTMAPLLGAVRGEPAVDVESWVTMIVSASQAFAEPGSPIVEFDANPVLLLADGQGALAVDAVVVTNQK